MICPLGGDVFRACSYSKAWLGRAFLRTSFAPDYRQKNTPIFKLTQWFRP
jgi:hypothetical protein